MATKTKKSAGGKPVRKGGAAKLKGLAKASSKRKSAGSSE